MHMAIRSFVRFATVLLAALTVFTSAGHAQTQAPKPSIEQSKLVRRYEAAAGGRAWEVSFESDTLYLKQAGSEMKVRLYVVSGLTYRVALDGATGDWTFNVDSQGRVTHLALRLGEQERQFIKVK
jgi:hypothetical protein